MALAVIATPILKRIKLLFAVHNAWLNAITHRNLDYSIRISVLDLPSLELPLKT